MNAILKVHELTKTFGSTKVLDGISFDMRQGEVISLIGSSGCGKSTALRCINFLETPTSGRIECMGQSVSVVNDERGRSQIVNGRDIRNLRRHIGMVFQNFNLWPHLSVLSNVTEALVWVLKLGEERRRRGCALGLVESRHGELPQPLSATAFGRAATTRRDCARSGNETKTDAVR